MMATADKAEQVRKLVDRYADGVEFDEAEHSYRCYSGRRYPSVTQILGRAGFDDWLRFIPKDTLERAQDRGTAVHLATQLHDEGDLDWASVDPAILPYVEQYAEWKEYTNYQVVAGEVPLVNRDEGFAGTPDKIGLVNGELAILDVKTCAVLPEAVALQLIAYADLLDVEFRCRRFALRLTGHGRPECREYSLQEAINGELAAWRAAHTLYRWRI